MPKLIASGREPGETGRKILAAIVRARTAWIAVAKLPAVEHPEGVVGVLAELAALDLVSPWGLPEPEGPAVTLSPLGAVLLGVMIHERIRREGDGYTEEPYWAPIDRPEPQLLLPKHAHECRLKLPELVVDLIPSPLEVLMDEEGEPVLLFGETVRIDRRIKGGGKAAKGKAAKRKAMRRAG